VFMSLQLFSLISMCAPFAFHWFPLVANGCALILIELHVFLINSNWFKPSDTWGTETILRDYADSPIEQNKRKLLIWCSCCFHWVFYDVYSITLIHIGFSVVDIGSQWFSIDVHCFPLVFDYGLWLRPRDAWGAQTMLRDHSDPLIHQKKNKQPIEVSLVYIDVHWCP
jgi:hypothetical protein